MKRIKPFILICLMSTLLLSACDDGGFSLSPSGDYDYVEEDRSMDPVEQPTGDGVHGGGDGANSEDNPQENTPQPDEIVPGESQEPAPQIDLGTQIITFTLSFVKVSEDDFVFITCSEDPFEDKYNFAYYTIDNQELDNSKSIVKETVEEKETYKLYLGSTESRTYTVQFYNESGKQYGKSEITVNNPAIRYSFFNNVVNIIELKLISVGMSFINQFNKVREFFRRIFGGRMI